MFIFNKTPLLLSALCFSAFNAYSTSSTPQTVQHPNNTSAIFKNGFEPTLEGKVFTKTIEVSGNLPANNPQYGLWKGTAPSLIYYANTDNSVDIVWQDPKTEGISLLKVDPEGKIKQSFNLTLKDGNEKLQAKSVLGFTKTPDGSHYIAFGTIKPYTYEEGNEALVPAGTVHDIGHYYIAKYDVAGKHVWTSHLFGDDTARKWGNNFNPGNSSSGRLEYDKEQDLLTYFVGSNIRTGRLQVHQGSAFGHLGTDGANYGRKGWYISHDYDQRILFDGDTTYFFGHGDSGPYGLYISTWKFQKSMLDGKPHMKSERGGVGAYAKYFSKIRNRTSYALGDIVGLGNREFAVAYTRGKEKYSTLNRGNFNVFFRHIAQNRDLQDFTQNKPLTTLAQPAEGEDPSKEQNGTARIAKFGDNFIIAWNNTLKPYAIIGEYDINGKAVVPPKMFDKVMLNPMFGMITLPNGKVFWASSDKEGSNKLQLNWIEP